MWVQQQERHVKMESKRTRLIRDFVAFLKRRLVMYYGRHLLGNADDDEEVVDSSLLACLQQLESTRYSIHRLHRTSVPRFAWFLKECSDRELLHSFRVRRSSFARLVVRTENYAVFAHAQRKMKNTTAAVHLLVISPLQQE